jgi:LysM repeat protein
MFKYLIFLLLILSSCTPIKSTSKDEKHQTELTLHKVQASIDDLRHDLDCFQTELQIVDGKIKKQEKSFDGIKQEQIGQYQVKVDTIAERLKALETKIVALEKFQQSSLSDLKALSSHATETSASLTQYKTTINELEKNFIVHSQRLEEVKKLKQTLEAIAATLKIDHPSYISYKVKQGDSLEKIARSSKTNVEYLKKLNNLDQDLIVVGQELKIPQH